MDYEAITQIRNARERIVVFQNSLTLYLKSTFEFIKMHLVWPK